jgi:hypothetical protein
MTTPVFNKIEAKEIQSDDTLTLSTTSRTVIKTDSLYVIKVAGAVTDGAPGTTPKFEFHSVRGSVDDPKELQPGDFTGAIRFTTILIDQHNEDVGKSLVVLLPQVDETADITDAAPTTNFHILLSAGDGKGSLENDKNYHAFSFHNSGTFVSQALKLDTASVDSIPPEPGTIVYNKELDKFQGYVKDAGLGKPGWVNLN